CRPTTNPAGKPTMPRSTTVSLFVFLCLTAAAGSADSPGVNWPRWRGPDWNANATDTGYPLKWDSSNIVWKTALPGQGQSSPIVWGDRIFLSSALEAGKQRLVICLERGTGKILWQQVAWKGTPEPTHHLNGWASSTCATDGEHVYAFFGKAGLHCY